MRSNEPDRKSKDIPYTVRLTAQDKERLGKIAELHEVSERELARRGIRNFLDESASRGSCQEINTPMGTIEILRAGSARRLTLTLSGSLLNRLDRLPDGEELLSGAIQEALARVIATIETRVRRADARFLERTNGPAPKKRTRRQPAPKASEQESA